MLAPFYWLMALARIIQGVSSTFVWTVGLALLCDTTPEARVGQQLGLAMAGLSAGVVLAPPIGGALYQRLGFNAPFIFSIGIVLLDLAGRLLVIERKHALPWGVDPAKMTTTPATDSDQTRTVQRDDSDATDKNSMLPPTPTEDSHQVDPLSLAGLNGTLVVVDGKHNDLVFGKFPVASELSPGSEQHDKTTTIEAIAPTAKEFEDNSRSLTSGSPVVFFDTAGQLTVVDSLQGQQFHVPQAAGMEKGGRRPPPQLQLDSNAVAAGGDLDKNPQLTSMQVLSAMCRSRRALAAFTNTLIYG
jgi:Major Facilitator Superfamily